MVRSKLSRVNQDGHCVNQDDKGLRGIWIMLELIVAGKPLGFGLIVAVLNDPTFLVVA
jgi:hypothetical protein